MQSDVVFNTALELGKFQARQMLLKLGWSLDIDVIWHDQKDFAYTNGKTFIALPYTMLGIKLTTKKLNKRAMMLLRSLISHELIHFLQPLNKVQKAEQESGLNHGVVNLILDIQGERMVERLFPEYKGKTDKANQLSYWRKLVWRKSGPAWREECKQHKEYWKTTRPRPDVDQMFQREISNMLLVARFGSPKLVHSVKSKRYAVTARAKTLAAFDVGYSTIPLSQKELPDFIRLFALAYPELCDQALQVNAPSAGDSSVLMKLAELRANPGNAPTDDPAKPTDDPDDKPDDNFVPTPPRLDDLISETMKTIVLTGQRAVKQNASTAALILSEQLSIKLQRIAAVTEIVAPVTMIRRQLALGQKLYPEPYKWTIPTKGKAISREILICVDHSASMAPIIADVTIASQAIDMAVRKDNGKVSALQFGTQAFVSSDDDNTPLYNCPVLFDDTDFRWMTYAWLKHPDKTIILITDADRGELPFPIDPADHARTHVICLGDNVNLTAAAYMGRVYHVLDVKRELPSVLLQISNTVKQ